MDAKQNLIANNIYSLIMNNNSYDCAASGGAFMPSYFDPVVASNDEEKAKKIKKTKERIDFSKLPRKIIF